MPSSLPKSPKLASCRTFVTQDPSRCARRSHVFHTSLNWINWSAGMSINSSVSVSSSVESTSSCKANNSEVKPCSLKRSEYQIWITAEAISFPPAIRKQKLLTWGFLSQTVVFPNLSSVRLPRVDATQSNRKWTKEFNLTWTKRRNLSLPLDWVRRLSENSVDRSQSPEKKNHFGQFFNPEAIQSGSYCQHHDLHNQVISANTKT